MQRTLAHTLNVLTVETIWVHLPFHSTKLHTAKEDAGAAAAAQIW